MLCRFPATCRLRRASPPAPSLFAVGPLEAGGCRSHLAAQLVPVRRWTPSGPGACRSRLAVGGTPLFSVAVRCLPFPQSSLRALRALCIETTLPGTQILCQTGRPAPHASTPLHRMLGFSRSPRGRSEVIRGFFGANPCTQSLKTGLFFRFSSLRTAQNPPGALQTAPDPQKNAPISGCSAKNNFPECFPARNSAIKTRASRGGT